MKNLHRVVILGGGFGGLYAAQKLKYAPVEVTVIDRRNFHLFQPLLYQVATGALSPGEISAPIRGLLASHKNTRVLLGEAVDINPQTKRILLQDGAEVEYDSLLVATGSQSTYFGNDKWKEWAPPLKSIEDATIIRHKILLAFEAAERTHDPEERREWLTFVIVGAGATGVELAGSLGEIANETLKHDFRSIRPQDARIIVVDGAPRTLMAYPEDLSRKAEQQLIKLGVRVRSGVKVNGVDASGVSIQTSSGAHEHIASRTVVWAAGVAVSDFARVLAQKTGSETDRGGKIKVSPELTIPGYPDIFVVGDLACSSGKDGKPLPGVAQVAMQGGVYAAKMITRRLSGQTQSKPFKYFDKGDMAVIGRGAAVANTFGVHLSGLLAWLAWLFIHLLYLVEFQSRIIVLIQWGFLYLSHSRSALLITGKAATDVVMGNRPLKNTVEK